MPPRRIARRVWPVLRSAALAIGLAGVAATGAAEPARSPQPRGEAFERMGLEALAVATHLYFFALGATIGSFLNVVVYRMPRGLGIVRPGSRCPRCLTSIRGRDNVPVLSWLWLRGRCRACGCPISPRYLLVELGTGLVFWGLLMVEVVSGGRNLPLRQPAFHRGVVWTVWSLDWGLLGIYAYHCLLVCLLVCLGLIRWDRMQAPRRLLAIGLAAGLALPLVWPELRPVPLSGTAAVASGVRPAAAALAEGLAGLAAGIVVGTALCSALRGARDGGAEAWAALGAAALVGVYFGWQAALSVGVLGSLVAMGLGIGGRFWPPLAGIPLCGSVGLATLGQIAVWKALSGLAWWPGPSSGALETLGSLSVIAGLAWLAGWLRPEPPAPAADAPLPPDASAPRDDAQAAT
jgi:leader peptidase (prepilin peptidase)/N-methyltransferase